IIFLLHVIYYIYFSPGIIFNISAVIADFLLIALWLAADKMFSKKLKFSETLLKLSGVSSEALIEAIDDGNRKRNMLIQLSGSITNPDVKKTVIAISEIIDDILSDIEKDPKDLKLAKKFLTYYLDTTIKIIKRYIDLSGRQAKSAEVKSSLEKTEDTLLKMMNAFRQMLTKLLEDDVMDLNSELQLLDRTIKVEGYDNEKI
ncbi:MAG: 5-bromo-4-chloroindolyl phosphate hydrolysis family protein, partial [Spirochaetes bacterium]|nr:5-bromo-4-chloroindolyl phosphate hydrolysis family protein [Spirochaetota bacterium]